MDKLCSALSRLTNNLLVLVCVSFMAGAILARVQAVPSPPAAAGLLSALVLLALVLHRFAPRTALVLTLPIFLLVGSVHTTRHLRPPGRPDHVYHLVRERQKITLTGTLTRMIEYDGTLSRLVVAVEEILPHTGGPARPVQASGLVRLAVRARITDLKPGDLLMARGMLSRIHNYRIPGGFDYRLHMAGKGIHVSGWIDSPAGILRIIDHDRSRIAALRYLPEQIRQEVGRFLRDHLDPTTAGVYQALLIGSRRGLSENVQEWFRATGTMHLLAISGLHMGLLSLLLSASIGSLLRRSTWLLLHTHVPALALAASLPVLLFYGFIAGMNVPVLRALTMAVLFLFAVLVRRQHTVLHLVACAALFTLAFHPLALFTASFQLSFSAVLALALLYPHLQRLLRQGRQSPGQRIGRAVLAALLVSLTATAGTLPFMLLHFNRVSLLGPFMNLLVEPLLCFWALPLGLLAIPWIWLAPGLAALLLQAGAPAIRTTLLATRLASTLPGSCLWTITPTWGEVLLYGLVLATCCLFLRQGSRVLRAVPAVLALALILSFTGPQPPDRPSGETRISYLDVGQGTAILLRLADGAKVLLDCGASRSGRFDVGERLVAPFLWRQRIRRLDRIIVTHPHADHFNGMGFILRHFRPTVLHVNGRTDGDPGYDRLLALADKERVPVRVLTAGETILAGKDFRLRCIGMQGVQEQLPANVNDNSLVIRLDHGRRGFLFPADISRRGEAILLAGRAELEADILLAPHHGSRGSGSKPFIARVAPGLIVISAGRYRLGTYPAPEHLAAWKQDNIRTWITGTSGTLTCSTDGNSLQCEDVFGREVYRKK